jgi:pimeloyl-ACP methyl ester carboxylesterase
VLNGRDWKGAAPPLLPTIGRLRPQPYWENKGPQAAAGLIVWSHGYMGGNDSTWSAPQGQVANFTRAGYDLYRFDREWIRDWPGDATQLAEATRQARAMGYRRVILAGQSAGAWVSLAATFRGAPVDGVISVAAAHHGYVSKMTDVTRARSEWQQIVRGIKPGPRIVVVNFAGDDYDVGGRMDDARSAFAASGVQAVVIADPPSFKGHGAGNDFAFPRKYGACIHAFIETGARQPPCG